MKQKYQSLIFSIAGAFAILAAIMIAAFVIAADKVSGADDKLNIMYQRAMYDVKDNLNNIELNLSKMLAAENQKINIEIAGDVSRQTQSASDNLMALPMDYHSVEGANKFLNQVGDFCVSYSRALVSDEDVSKYEDKLEELYNASRKLNKQFTAIVEEVGDSGNIVSELNRKELDASYGLGEDTIINSPIDYPEIIYDGPFSDTRGKKCFKLLDKLPTVNVEQAKENLKKCFEGFEFRTIQQLGESSEPEAYLLGGYIASDRFYASVSKRGGKLISFNRDVQTGGVRISEKKAAELALKYAQKAGFDELKEVWYNDIEGVAVINFAPLCNDIIYYTDLVKVKVSLTDGSLIGIEALGYCTNHCERDLNALISENTAKQCLPEKFDLVEIRLALIPLNMGERLTYELSCTYSDLDYFIYVDAETGKVVNIMRVVDNNQGKLVL